MYRILVADIGATNSRFAIFTANMSPSGSIELQLKEKQQLASAQYPSFYDAVLKLQEEAAFSAASSYDLVILALAGPIKDGNCKLSNLPWYIQKQEAEALFNAKKLIMINDFAAQGYACLIPDFMKAATIQVGTPVQNAPVAVIGAGTGLGKTLLIPITKTLKNKNLSARKNKSINNILKSTEDHLSETTVQLLSKKELKKAERIYLVASEGGNADFPFVDTEELAFGSFLRQEGGWKQITGDAVLTGSGLGHLYAFMTGFRLADYEVPKEVSLRRPDILARYARFYGRACRNYILETLALGGLYITGGMALRLPVLSHPEFLREFHNSPIHSQLMHQVPIYHIQSHHAGLWGAALYGVLQLKTFA